MATNPYRLEFKLKQHTPLLHFHPHAHATIRATEIKPKLDKFLIAKLGGWQNVPNEWVVGGKKKEGERTYALNYGMAIRSENVVSIPIENQDNGGDKIPFYFGNKGNNYSLKYKSYTLSPLFVQLNLRNTHKVAGKTLGETIEGHISEFFCKHNFGTRQSKGYGSFYLEDEGAFPFRYYKTYFDINVGNASFLAASDTALNATNLFYNTLRSGINQYGRSNSSIYFKSLMFLYSKEKLSYQWDKKTIKENFFLRQLTEETQQHHEDDILSYRAPYKYLMRDLLGLASDSSWRAKYNDTITKTHVNKKIDRYKSPILFKPVRASNGSFRVYMNYEPIPTEFLDQEFKIENSRGRDFKISTPTKFEIKSFLLFASNVDIRSHVKFKNGPVTYSRDLQLLEGIYSNIRNNLNQ